jgi:hypothetical protein
VASFVHKKKSRYDESKEKKKVGIVFNLSLAEPFARLIARPIVQVKKSCCSSSTQHVWPLVAV